MNIDRFVMMFAGSMSLLGLALAAFISPWWILLPLLVGVMLIVGPLTGFCPMAFLVKKLGLKPGSAFFDTKRKQP